jgi:signal transduction histidine kinase
LLEQLWIAVLAVLLLAFPEGRSSRPVRWAIAGIFAVTLAGQAVGALVDPDTRDVLSLAPHEGVAHAIDRTQEIAGLALALVVLLLVLRRLLALRGARRRSQGPLLAAGVLAVSAGLAWLGSVIAADASRPRIETIARAIVVCLPVGVVVGILWSRLRRPEASALSDPTLEIAYRLGDELYVDAAGRPVELPRDPNRAITAITAGGEEVAVLIHDPVLLDEPALVESVCATAALVLEIERLAAEVRSQLAEVRASRERLVSAADAERRRIERDLHDGAQQRLAGLALQLRSAQRRLDSREVDPQVEALLESAVSELQAANEELRELVRGVYPAILTEEGLAAALESLALRNPFPIELDVLEGRLPPRVEATAYFVTCEGLANVMKHAQASTASVCICRRNGLVAVEIADDGVGGARPLESSGLSGLADRVEALGGRLRVESPVGLGTRVVAEIPCES